MPGILQKNSFIPLTILKDALKNQRIFFMGLPELASGKMTACHTINFISIKN